MIDILKEWIINIASLILFITAVEMLLPDNSLKKYSKFVLGLILMTVLINPIIKIFNKNFNISVYSQNISRVIYDEEKVDSIEKYKEESLKNTIKNFETNLEQIIGDKLKDEFKVLNTKIEIQAEYSDEDNNFNIKDIKIGIKDGKVEKVKKVKVSVGEKTLEEKEKDKLHDDIKSYLSKELRVEESIITVYKL
ncbi:stage III sporulation protein AF [Clostridium sp. MSJ-11]|uniref:Stage III sporulation protein AF n=1 Tax=Clostridium mobile TaxID=2841512 RepID=A0ABS6ED49_9CLOT|nr:stage III sporulation protein AF [Clostridium mobile]MBU5482945.1 stage III sporulation protein AF [Clostridium mobile]